MRTADMRLRSRYLEERESAPMTAERLNMATNPLLSSSRSLRELSSVETVTLPIQLLCALLDAVGGSWTIGKGDLEYGYPKDKYFIEFYDLRDPVAVRLVLKEKDDEGNLRDRSVG